MWLCVCGHPRLCFLWYLVLFLGFELKFLRRKFLNLDKKLIWLKRMWFLKTFGIIDMHFIAWNLVLRSVSAENFSFSIFFFFWVFRSRSIKLVFWLIEKVQFLDQNSLPDLIPSSIPLDHSNLFLKLFRFLARFLPTDRKSFLFKN